MVGPGGSRKLQSIFGRDFSRNRAFAHLAFRTSDDLAQVEVSQPASWHSHRDAGVIAALPQ